MDLSVSAVCFKTWEITLNSPECLQCEIHSSTTASEVDLKSKGDIISCFWKWRVFQTWLAIWTNIATIL